MKKKVKNLKIDISTDKLTNIYILAFKDFQARTFSEKEISCKKIWSFIQKLCLAVTPLSKKQTDKCTNELYNLFFTYLALNNCNIEIFQENNIYIFNTMYKIKECYKFVIDMYLYLISFLR